MISRRLSLHWSCQTLSHFVSVNYVTRKRFIAVLLLANAATVAAQNAGGRPIHNEQERLAKWKPVQMPFHSTGLSARERQMVEKLVEACRLLDAVYWRQSDIGGPALYQATPNPTLEGLVSIIGGRR